MEEKNCRELFMVRTREGHFMQRNSLWMTLGSNKLQLQRTEQRSMWRNIMSRREGQEVTLERERQGLDHTGTQRVG